MNRYFLLIVFFSFLTGNHLQAQINTGGIPESFNLDDCKNPFQEISISPPNVNKLIAEDLADSDKASPHRFAILLPLNVNLENSGTWEILEDGSKIWRVKLMSQGALALNLYFDHFYLPEGCKLFLYDEDGNQIKGAYTFKNNHESKLFATELINDDNVIVELFIPAGIKENAVVSISDFAYAYRSIPFSNASIDGFGSSDFCEINVNCSPEGENWQHQNNGVVRILIKVNGASFWCSGSLVNNVNYDFTPYVLTADHCAFKFNNYASPSDLNQWIFYFNYESETCENPSVEPAIYSMTGAEKVAQGGDRGSSGSDFYLVLLNENVPDSFEPYYNGWSILNEGSNSGVGIHHPEGDIKKISTYVTPLLTSQWSSNGLMSHWKVIWAETDNNWAVTEGGSSGSPIFDDGGRIIGTLTGGQAACTSSGGLGPDKPDYYGKFSWHWDENGIVDSLRLKPWLDPNGSGIQVLDGTAVGISEKVLSTLENIIVYPNPVIDVIYIKFITFEADEVDISFVDILGKPIGNFINHLSRGDISIDVSGFPAGMYYARIKNGQQVVVKKIIKQ